MNTASRFRLPALACAFVLPVCALFARPGVETGMMDEWSYIWTARILAQTGHVVFNGWADPICGWLLIWGAVFFKLFGVSFLVARLSVLVISMASIFLAQRCMVRAGITEWNASLGALTIALTPMFLSISLGFMTDIPGMFAIVVCLYACLRALQARTDRAQLMWLCFATLGNAIGGTARQIAWVAMLVMVPCTIWLLRKKRKAVLVGAASYVLGVCFMLVSLYWFHQQPYSVAMTLGRQPITMQWLFYLPANIMRPVLETALIVSPVTIMFLPSLWRSRRQAKAAAAGVLGFGMCAGLWILVAARGHHRHGYPGRGLLAPFMTIHGSYLSQYGLFSYLPLHFGYPVVLHTPIRVLLSLITFATIAAVSVSLSNPAPPPSVRIAKYERLSSRAIAILLLPFMAGVATLMLQFGTVGYTLDRYLLPVLPALMILILRLYQSRVGWELPRIALVIVLLTGLYSVAATHDLFATYRATLEAIDEVRATGVPRTQIDGGWEYDAWTQLENSPYIQQPGVRLPKGVLLAQGNTMNQCHIDYLPYMPVVVPRYSLSFQPNICGGNAPFEPVSYTRWLGPHHVTVYVVKNPVIVNDGK